MTSASAPRKNASEESGKAKIKVFPQMNRRRTYHMAVPPCLPQGALYRRRRNINPVTIVDGRFWLFRPASIFARTAGSTTGVVSDMPMTLRRLLKVFAALFVLSACSPLTILNATIGEDGFTVQSGLSFGPEVRHGLDVYVPKPRTGLSPIVVFFYGGNWRAGERANYLFVAAALASRGYVTIVPDYRLFPDVRFPAFVEDGAKAVRWVLDHLAEFAGDPDRLYLMGHSAGAHIAAMLTLDERYLAAEGVPRNAIRGTIALAGPYAFYPSRTASVAPIFAHLADENAARPIKFVDGDEAPMLLLHGADDNTVFVYNTTNLSKAVREAGGSARHIIYPDVGHLEIVFALARPFRGIAPVLSDTAAFIDGQRSPSAAAQ